MLYIDPSDFYFSFGFGFGPHSNNIGAGRFRHYLETGPVARYGISHLDTVFSNRHVIDEKIIHASDAHQHIRPPINVEYLLTAFLKAKKN